VRPSIVGSLLNSLLVVFELLVEPLIEPLLFREVVDVLFTLLKYVLPELMLAQGDHGSGLRVLEFNSS
jgi:hypothetical protein